MILVYSNLNLLTFYLTFKNLNANICAIKKRHSQIIRQIVLHIKKGDTIMQYRLFFVNCTLSLLLLSVSAGLAQSPEEKLKHQEMPVFCKEFIGQIDFVQGRIMQLAEAVPQENYTWRPAEGVRSISEVYRHVAFANYLFSKFSGYEAPEEAIIDPDREKWDKATTDKTEIAETLTKSFDVVRASAKKISAEDLEKMVEVFGMEMSLRNFMVSSLNHLHEHLGQSIAYARSNGVVPPWSAKAAEETESK